MPLIIMLTYALLTGLTAVYCILLWYGAAMWGIFFNHADFGSLPLISRIGLAQLPLPVPWQMIHWQLLSICFLFVCITHAAKMSREHRDAADYTPVLILYTVWILLAVCFHLLAAVLPMVSVGHIL